LTVSDLAPAIKSRAAIDTARKHVVNVQAGARLVVVPLAQASTGWCRLGA